MSSSSTLAPERESHLLAVGQQCSADLCHLVDFLPFKCQHCSQPFCAEHYLPNQHKCDKYDETKHNRVAPSCPLCNTPVAIPPGQDPNIRMERHINAECSVTTGKSAKSSTPHCARAKCGKVLFQPIRCDSCKQQYCPQHRFPKDHSCSSATASSSTTKSQTAVSAAKSAGLAAIKRATTQSSTPAVRATGSTAPAPAPAKPAPAASSSRSNPFSKTDRPPAALPLPPTAPDATTTHEHPNDPPKSCVPKSIINARSFAPPPLFASA